MVLVSYASSIIISFNRMRFFFFFLALAIVLGGCSSRKVVYSNHTKASAVANSARFDSLLLFSKTWNMVKIESSDRIIDVPADEEATLVFDQQASRVYGRCCNSYFGTFELKGNIVTFDKMGATKMMCMGAIGDIERIYHALLANPQTITVDESTLVLKSDQGTITFKAGKVAK